MANGSVLRGMLVIVILFYLNTYLAQDIGNSINELQWRIGGHKISAASDPNACPPLKKDIKCKVKARYRTIDGSCNNLQNPTWGQAMQQLRRFLPAQYNPGGTNAIRTVGRLDRPLPSARKVSTTIHQLATTADFSPTLTSMHMLWGQFIDHDITHTPLVEMRKCCGVEGLPHPDCIPISVPEDDPHWGTRGNTCMELRRSHALLPGQCKNNHREQLNRLTSFIDAGMVYGSTTDRTSQLRSFVGGRMVITKGGLPTDTPGTNCQIPPEMQMDRRCFAAGDVRCNVWSSLTAIHELFVREHNRIADILYPTISRKYSHLNRSKKDEKTFQETKRIIAALLQVINYREYLPNVLGAKQMKKYDLHLSIDSGQAYKYRPNKNPTATNVFATSAFRFGHAEIPFGTTPIQRNFYTNVTGLIPYDDMFNQPHTYRSNGAFGPFIRSVTVEPAMSITGSGRFSVDVRDELFTKSFGGLGLDLPAVNTQRGRDHGLPPYNEWRKFCGLRKVTFENMPDHRRDVQNRFARLYEHPDDIDLYPAASSEIPLPGTHVGPTFACLLGLQFKRLKEGDRFWFESRTSYPKPFSPSQITQLSNVRISKLICENAKTKFVPENVFKLNSPMTACKDLPELDLYKWL